MTKDKIKVLIPLLIISGLLINCWALILFEDVAATWRHYSGLILFLPLPFLFLKNVEACIIATGSFLLLATFNVLAITPAISTFWIKIGPVPSPPVQLLSLGLFILYGILNMYSLFDIYLDYKERKEALGKK